MSTTKKVSHPALGWLTVSDDVAVGAWKLDQQPFSFPCKAIVCQLATAGGEG
jgi:hypothetical protein